MFAQVVLSKITPKLDKIYDYSIPDELKSLISIGSQVEIPFGNGNRIGFVVGFSENSDVLNIKPITKRASDHPVFNETQLKIAKWIADYYLSYFVTALRAMLPPAVRKKGTRSKARKPALESGIGNKSSQLLSPNDYTGLLTQSQNSKGQIYLLTAPSVDIYIELINKALNENGGAILLTPEIGLTENFVLRLKAAFQDNLAILHSGLTDKERSETWERIVSAEKTVVLGTRIALFAPVKNLKLIILDEEFETTYKQEQNPRYDARTVAEYMACEFGITCVFASSTPSIETFYKAQTGKYKLLEGENKKPASIDMRICDMRTAKGRLLSPELRQALKSTLENSEKAILFLNRRGFFTTQTCRNCGYSVQCPNCAVSLTYHYKQNQLICGHCGHTSPINIVCPKCQSSDIAFLGIGTQRIEEEIGEFYPKAKIVRIDRDSVTKKGSHEVLFSAFTHGDANVLIGTQMVTKGLEVPNVTLVGVISADSMLNLPDFRSTERAFQQLVQVAGRAGHGSLPSKVIIQTLNPDHFVIKHAVNFDYLGFYNEEIKNREELNYPPFSKLINIIIHGKEEKTVIKISNDLKAFLNRDLARLPDGQASGQLGSTLLGPAKAPIEKIRGEFRYQILIKTKDLSATRARIREILSKLVVPYGVRINVDIEPINLL